MSYDFVIVGGGSAAFSAAYHAEINEVDTLMINDSEKLPLGGTCVNVGCIPSKTLLHVSKQYHQIRRGRVGTLKTAGNSNLVEILSGVKDKVRELRKKNYENVIKNQDHVDLVEGAGTLTGRSTVKVGGEEYTGKKILIATGASPAVPPIRGIQSVDYLTYKSALDLEEVPESVVIIGGGPTGLEWGQIFHHFGVEITIIEKEERILPKEDPLIAEKLSQYLESEGFRIRTGADVKRIEKSGEKTLVEINQGNESEAVIPDRLFVAAGIKPNTGGLNLEEIGVETDLNGFIPTDPHLRTSKPGIYAAGDVTKNLPLETVAAREARVAFLNAFEGVEKTIDYKTIPRAVFTSPQVASVGITEGEYRRKNGTCLCSTISFEHSEAARTRGDTRGIIRMVLNHRTKEVVGVQIVGPMATELITTASYAVENEMTVREIQDMIHVFPTHNEMIKKVAQSFEQDLDEMSCCVG